MKILGRKKGFTILEVVLSVAVLAIIATSFYPVIGWLLSRSKKLQHDSQAAVLMQEGIEVAYNVLLSDWDENWDMYPDTSIYHPVKVVSANPSGFSWGLSGGLETNIQTRFSRKIELTKVCRNTSDGNIKDCAEGYPEDSNAKLITTTISWEEGGATKSISGKLMVSKL